MGNGGPLGPFLGWWRKGFDRGDGLGYFALSRQLGILKKNGLGLHILGMVRWAKRRGEKLITPYFLSDKI